ncbi:hypothetical protein [Breznakia pachnodae]|uniref:Uncharacterized protein n=1 Tax=Breznakia pachnodae TaxID=265178 RepID=A0ABU0E0E7_9FIRM|nr:hypothetical protein [Breznakia pachnodae]MDQ0360354.1 hypothetical protein [Breznakia pachnodae]
MQKIEATANPLNIKVSNVVSVVHLDNTVDIIPNQISLEEVPIGSKLKIDVTITNYESEFPISVGVTKKLGFQYYAYNKADFKVNGNLYSEEQYNQFINNKSLDTTLQKQLTLSFYAKYTGVEDNLLSMNVSVASNRDGNTAEHVSSFDYSVDTKYKQKYLVNFYDYNNSLLDAQIVNRNSLAKVPIVYREGYKLKEFNTKKDGSGEKYESKKVRNTADYYAIYEKKTFTVSYYIGDNLYANERVNYGEAAPLLVINDSEFGEFVGWSEELSSIKSNLNVYALFRDKDGNVHLDNQVSDKSKVNNNNLNYSFMLIDRKTSSEVSKGGTSSYITYANNHKFTISESKDTVQTTDSITTFLSSKGISILLYLFFIISVIYIFKKLNLREPKKKNMPSN